VLTAKPVAVTGAGTAQAEVRCVVGDDHEALRHGLVALLEAEQDLSVVGQAADGRVALELVERRAPDVAVLDVGMPTLDGIEIAEALAARGLSTQVVLYTAHGDPALVERALDAGARGFVLKSGPPQDLVRAVRAVRDGQLYLDALLAARVLEQRSRTPTGLSERERQVLGHLADGLTTEAVAGTLFLSPGTVRSYAENAARKLDARNRTHAVAVALRRGLID
jgi:DNA-binding NarL/FixJ family response regulator